MSTRLRKSLVLLAILTAFGLLLFGITRTATFERFLARRLVTAIEGLTGGQAEIQSLRFRLEILQVTVRGLVIHGKERQDEAPLFSTPVVVARLNPLSLFRAKVMLRSLEWDEAEIHVYTRRDGTTNLPVPAASP